MSFLVREGADGTRAVDLITLSRGSGVLARVWRYATLDTDVTVSGLTYRASTMQCGTISREQTSGRATLQITTATATEVVAEWQAVSALDPVGPIGVTVLRAHVTSAGAVETTGETTWARFLGTVSGMEISGAETVLSCEALANQLATRTVPRVPILTTCPWAVYGHRCGVNPTSVAESGTVTAVGVAAPGSPDLGLYGGTPTVTITMATSAPLLLGVDPDLERFNGGVLVWSRTTPDGPSVSRIHIMQASVNTWPTLTCVLYTDLGSAAVGQTVSLWPGCQKTIEICFARFNNKARFGGFPGLPDRNPLLRGLE